MECPGSSVLGLLGLLSIISAAAVPYAQLPAQQMLSGCSTADSQLSVLFSLLSRLSASTAGAMYPAQQLLRSCSTDGSCWCGVASGIRGRMCGCSWRQVVHPPVTMNITCVCLEKIQPSPPAVLPSPKHIFPHCIPLCAVITRDVWWRLLREWRRSPTR